MSHVWSQNVTVSSVHEVLENKCYLCHSSSKGEDAENGRGGYTAGGLDFDEYQTWNDFTGTGGNLVLEP